MAIILETPRLVLSELTLDDLDFLSMLLGDPQVMRYYPKTYDRAEAAGMIRQQQERYERDGIGCWLAREKSSGQPIGRIGLQTRPIDGVIETELAWMVHTTFQRRGYASEGGAACRDHGLGALGLPRVVALVRPENLPSCGVAEKLGLTICGRTVISDFEHHIFTTPTGDSVRTATDRG